MADAQSEAGWSVVSEEHTLTTAQLARITQAMRTAGRAMSLMTTTADDFELVPVQGTFAEILRALPDSKVSNPLWNFRPADRPAVLAERRRRGLLQDDAEPIGDPEYT